MQNKQIEEMAKAIDQAKYDMWVGKAHQGGDFTRHSENIAKALYNAGYRKDSEVAREIFEHLECMFSPVFIYTGETIEEYIAELEKKYTEEGK